MACNQVNKREGSSISLDIISDCSDFAYKF